MSTYQSVKVDPETYQQLKTTAFREGRTICGLIRLMTRAYVKKMTGYTPKRTHKLSYDDRLSQKRISP